MQKLLVIIGIMTLGLTACSSPTRYEIVEMPQREADLYPLSETKDGITVAVDEITNTERSMQYFGVDMFKHGIVPVNVVISNHTGRKQLVSPVDVLLLRGRQAVIDPLPIQRITNLVNRDYWYFDERTYNQLSEYFNDLTMQEMVLMPNDVYQGVLFFKAVDLDKAYRDDSNFNVTRLYPKSSLNIKVSVADLETRERMHFGPFPISVR